LVKRSDIGDIVDIGDEVVGPTARPNVGMAGRAPPVQTVAEDVANTVERGRAPPQHPPALSQPSAQDEIPEPASDQAMSRWNFEFGVVVGAAITTIAVAAARSPGVRRAVARWKLRFM
jgi:hypothetical protein